MNNRVLRGMALMVSVSILAAGCAPTPENCAMNQTATGAAIGAGVGGVLGGVGAALGGARGGTGFAIAAGAAAVGALIGGAIGAQQDQVCRQIALNKALEQAAAVSAEYQRRQEAAAAASAQNRQASRRSAPAKVQPPQYETVQWTNPSTKASGAITPTGNVTETAGGGTCMAFTETEVVGGVPKQVEKRACRDSDGKWNPV